MKKKIVGVILFLGVAGALYASIGSVSMYKYNDYHSLPERPFPTELLVEVKEIKDIQVSNKPLVNSPSIIVKEYVKQLDCVNKKDGSKLGIHFTEVDFKKVNPKVGMVYAVFGFKKSDGNVFKMYPYSGPQDKKAMEDWFTALR